MGLFKQKISWSIKRVDDRIKKAEQAIKKIQ